jgi:hypothetical protein
MSASSPVKSRRFVSEEIENLPPRQPEPQPAPVEEFIVEETPEGEQLSVYLGYLPTDPKSPTHSNYEAYFINASNYYLHFSYLNRINSSWELRYVGLIEPNTRIFMEEFDREVIPKLEYLCIQLTAFKRDKPFFLKPAHSIELRLDVVKFYKPHCFLSSDYFEEPALIIPVIESDTPERSLSESVAELQSLWTPPPVKDRPAPPKLSKPKAAPPPVIEIDLHITQLMDTTAGMNASDILNYQLDVFHKTMREHANKKGQKIVFIHGKGEGVLRKAIEKELKTRYRRCEFQDASFLEYGLGATLVKIR